MVLAQNWQTNYGEALALASKSERPIVLVFSGSDWCAPCIKLDRAIWQSQDFQEYAQNNFVLLKADFPRKKSNQLSEKRKLENQQLAHRFNPKGHFPLVVVLDNTGRLLGKTGYKKMSPQEYISHLNSFLR